MNKKFKELLKVLKERKLLKDVTDEKKLLNLPENSGVYIGFDPTSQSLHLGNYIQIRILQLLKKLNIKAFAVLGGATGRIGDPSDKKKERQLIDEKQLKNNISSLKKQIEHFSIPVLDNNEFYKNMSVITFLREFGKRIGLGYLLAKDFVKKRLNEGISFAEFSYQLLQGSDFVFLNKKYNIRLQIGGSDQWGNITTGIELIKKINPDEKNAVGLTLNLLTTDDGQKIGKTSDKQVVFLDRKLTSPYLLYQFFYNVEDKNLENFFLWFTSIPLKKIKMILANHKKKPQFRNAQKILAFELVKDIHSLKDAEDATKISEYFFGKKSNLDKQKKLLSLLEDNFPTFNNLKNKNILDILVKIKAAISKSEAKKLIASRGIMINNDVLSKKYEVITSEEFKLKKVPVLIRRGKKFIYLIKN